MKVLVVVDDLVVRRHIESALERGNYKVIGVADGIAAWEILRRDDTPRLLVLDWAMDGLSGPELLARMHEQPGRLPSYVVMTSVRGRPDDIVEALEAGADDYMVKPIHAGELRARVNAGARILGRQIALEGRIALLGDRAA